MPVYVFAYIVGDVFDEKRGEVHGLVGDAADAERPFKVVLVQLPKALAFRQEASVGNPRPQGVVLAAQEALDGLYQPRLLAEADA